MDLLAVRCEDACCGDHCASHWPSVGIQIQNEGDATQSDDSASEWFLEFEEHETEPSRWGFNPRARGYRKAAWHRRICSLALCLTVAIVSLGLWLCGRLPTWLAVVGIVAPMLAATTVEWRWRNSRFCELCGVRTKSPRSPRAFIWWPACHGLCDPAGIVRYGGRPEITSGCYFGHIDPVLKCTNIVMLLGIKDHAQEIRFEPEQDAFEICVVVDGQVFKMVSPPIWLHVPVAQAIKVLAGLDPATSDRRQEGHIDILCGGHPVPTDVLVEPAEFGEKVTMRFTTEYWLPKHASPASTA
jgi:hypothetical protein